MANANKNSQKGRELGRIERENKWWGMHDKCCEQFPRLDPKVRGWFNRYKSGDAFNNLPYDMRTAMHALKTRVDGGFASRQPLADCLVEGKKPCKQQEEMEARPALAQAALPAGKGLPGAPGAEKRLYDPAMEQASCADPVSKHLDIVAFWSAHLASYAGFIAREGRRPSNESESMDEKRLACGQNRCMRLARAMKLPLEAEILLSNAEPCFDAVEIWKKKLSQCTKIFSGTGDPPSYSGQGQRHLAHWYYVVSSLHARCALPDGAEWLAENFGPISSLNNYLALAHIIGEENIVAGAHGREVSRCALWKAEMRSLHGEGKLPQGAVEHFREFSSLLPPGR